MRMATRSCLHLWTEGPGFRLDWKFRDLIQGSPRGHPERKWVELRGYELARGAVRPLLIITDDEGDCAKVGCGGRSLRSPLWLGEAPVDPSWPGLSFLLPTPIGFLSDWLFAVAA